jgi:LemA protein
MTTTLWIIIGVVVLFLWLTGVYNSLIRAKNRTDEAWSDIDVQLKRRYNLIPNLVETVKGYAKHERELFEKVTQARTTAMGAQTPKCFIRYPKVIICRSRKLSRPKS